MQATTIQYIYLCKQTNDLLIQQPQSVNKLGNVIKTTTSIVYMISAIDPITGFEL